MDTLSYRIIQVFTSYIVYALMDIRFLGLKTPPLCLTTLLPYDLILQLFKGFLNNQPNLWVLCSCKYCSVGLHQILVIGRVNIHLRAVNEGWSILLLDSIEPLLFDRAVIPFVGPYWAFILLVLPEFPLFRLGKKSYFSLLESLATALAYELGYLHAQGHLS